MKKIQLLIVFVTICINFFASPLQSTWRWRNDNGSEVSATWIKGDTVSIKICDTTKVLRLRIRIDNTYSDPYDVSSILKYSTEKYGTKDSIASGDWTTISDDHSNAFVFAESSYVNDGDPTSSQINRFVGNEEDSIATSTFEFLPGQIFSSSTFNTFSLPAYNKTEVEFCIKATKNIKKETTYYFILDAVEVYPDHGVTLPNLKFVDDNIPVFVVGKEQSVSCAKNDFVLLNEMLAVNDTDINQILTWSVLSAPTHGTLNGFPKTAGSGGSSVVPENDLKYIPATDYTGNDAFTIVVSDDISSDTIKLNITVGTTGMKLNTQNDFVVYPNPATDNITVSYSPTEAYSQVSILDITGKVIKSINTEMGNVVPVFIGDLAKGIYYVQMKGQKGSKIQKIIKQ